MYQMNLQIIRKNPLSLPVLIAEDKKYFEKNHLKVHLDIQEDFLFDGNRAFFKGLSDAMMGDLTFFFYMLEEGKQAVVTSNLTRTICVVGGKGVHKNQAKLRIGANPTGLLRFFLKHDLHRSIPHVEIVWIKNSYERLKALETKEIDALVAIEPFVNDALKYGGDILWHSKDSDKNMVMWAFDKTYYTEHFEGVKAFHKALEESMNFFNALAPSEKVKIAQKYGHYPEDFAQHLSCFEFEPQEMFSKKDFTLCQNWMVDVGEIKNTYSANQYIKSFK